VVPSSSPTVARLTIPADAAYLGICRLAATGIADSVGLGDEQLADLQLAVSEVCADAILNSEDAATIEIVLRLPAEEIEVAVQSSGSVIRDLPELLTTLLGTLTTRWVFAESDAGGACITFAVSRQR